MPMRCRTPITLHYRELPQSDYDDSAGREVSIHAWARLTPMKQSNQEQQEQHQQVAVGQYECVIPNPQQDVSPEWWIVWNQTRFDIVAVHPRDMGSRYLTMTLRQRSPVAGGVAIG